MKEHRINKPIVLNPQSKTYSLPEFILKELVNRDSYVIQDAFNEDHGAIYEYKAINTRLEKEMIDNKNGIFWVPKWCICVSALICTTILITLIASLIVVFTASRNYLYGESCLHRSCDKNYNLKCINNTCLCNTDEYYMYKCLNKNSYLEKCYSEISNCNNNLNLICVDGYCICSETMYWDSLKCTSRRNYTQECSTNICLTNLMLECISGFCLCNVDRYWDGTVCALKRRFQESCSTSISLQCDNRKKLICINETCSCTNRQFNDQLNNMCSDSFYENIICAYTYQCLSPMTCVNNTCQCGVYQYYDNDTMSCLNQTSYNTSCMVSLNCRIDQGLICVFGVCVCDSSIQLWSSILNKCINLYTYGEIGCIDDSNCVSGLNLKCFNSTQNNICNCPTTTQLSMCDCTRTFGSEFYWNGTSCVPALSYGQLCISGQDYMCKTITEGSICNGTCVCPTNYFYNSSNYCEYCPPNWNIVNDVCFYKIENTPLCWNDAQLECANYGGKLIQFSNSSVLNYISNFLNSMSYWVGARGYGNGGGCGSGCPIKWIENGGCGSCGGDGNSSCLAGCGAANCPNTCTCSGTKCGCGASATSLTWCSTTSISTNHCLLYNHTSSCFSNAACTDINSFICEK